VVDVETGESRPGIGRPASYEDLDEIGVATDLLHRPLAEVDDAGRSVPGGLAGVAAATILALGLGWLLRRGRRLRQERVLATGGEQ
jgi:hypothetical protein